MHRKLYKELWRIRFQKMLALEEQSITDYQSLLKDCKKTNKNPSIIEHLENLISDEKKHALLCKELLRIVERQES